MRSAGAGDGDWIRAAATGKGGHYTLRGVRTAAYDLEAPHPSRLSESRVRVTGRPRDGRVTAQSMGVTGLDCGRDTPPPSPPSPCLGAASRSVAR